MNKIPDITLKDAIRVTKKAGFNLNYVGPQTVAADLFQLKKEVDTMKFDLKNQRIENKNIIVGIAFATLLIIVTVAVEIMYYHSSR